MTIDFRKKTAEPVGLEIPRTAKRTDITSSKTPGFSKSVEVLVGGADDWICINKARSVDSKGNPLWMKSTKVYNTPTGYWMQVTSEHYKDGAVTAVGESHGFCKGENWDVKAGGFVQLKVNAL